MVGNQSNPEDSILGDVSAKYYEAMEITESMMYMVPRAVTLRCVRLTRMLTATGGGGATKEGVETPQND
jgi:hypothetical protein